MHRLKARLVNLSKGTVAVLYTALAFGPLLWVFTMSLRTTEEIRKNPYALPEHWRWSSYVDVWTNSGYQQYFINSVLVVGAAVAIILVVSSMAAYAFAKLPFRGSEIVFIAIFATIMLPVQILLIPLFQNMTTLNLINSRIGLSLIYVAVQMPISIYILRSFFAQIPKELREAAKIDGCSELRTFWSIMLPMAWPALSTVVVINFVALWNEFLLGSVFIQNEAYKTLPVGIIKFVGDVNEDLGSIATGLMIAVIPVIVLYSIFSEHFMKGMAAGAVKG